MPDPNQSNSNQTDPAVSPMPTGPILTQSPNPVTSMQPDLPPLPPDFQSTPTTSAPPAPTATPPEKTEESGSAAPGSLLPPMSVTPKKKFGGGRIIATILGLFLLVGGIGAGIVLTGQQQIFEQKAAGCVAPKHLCSCHAGSGCVGASTSCDAYCGGGGNVVGATPSGGGGGGGTTTPGTGGCSSGKHLCSCNAGSGCVGNGTSCTSYCGSAGNIKCDSNVSSNCSTGTGTGGTGTGGLPTNCTTEQAINGYCPAPASGRGCLDTGCGNGLTCHCQGGVACPYGACVPTTNFNTACTGDKRVVCSNPVHPQAVTCCSAGYVCGSGGGCVQETHTSPPGTGGGGPTASCQGTKVYSSAYVALTPADISHLAAGNTINFCVSGTTSAGNFDKGMFTINGVAQPETTTKRPGTDDFCQSYTIKATDTTVHAVGQIHHVTLGWEQ